MCLKTICVFEYWSHNIEHVNKQLESMDGWLDDEDDEAVRRNKNAGSRQ